MLLQGVVVQCDPLGRDEDGISSRRVELADISDAPVEAATLLHVHLRGRYAETCTLTKGAILAITGADVIIEPCPAGDGRVHPYRVVVPDTPGAKVVLHVRCCRVSRRSFDALYVAGRVAPR